MAKKKSIRITTTEAIDEDANVLMHMPGILPNYDHYFKTSDFHFWFENKKESDQVHSSKNIGIRKIGFHIVEDGQHLVSRGMTEIFARMIMKAYLSFGTDIARMPSMLKSFFTYCHGQKDISTIEQITHLHMVEFFKQLQSNKKATIKKLLSSLFDEHPYLKSLRINSITLRVKRNFKGFDKKISAETFDMITGENKDYSKRVLLQLLACSYYELEVWRERFERMLFIDEAQLGKDYIERPSNACKTTYRLLSSGFEGHEKLYDNLLYYNKKLREGYVTRDHTNNHWLFYLQSSATSGAWYKQEVTKTYFKEFKKFLNDQLWKTNSKSKFREFHSFETYHWDAVLMLYMMITTGANSEVIGSLKRNYKGNTPWYDNLDVELGVTRNGASSQRDIKIVGKKKKGKKVTDYPLRISTNSSIFKFMKLYDEMVKDPNRELFFRLTNSSSLYKKLGQFCEFFSIKDDDNILMDSINTLFLRKTYAGTETIKLLNNIGSATELVTKLRNALNHKSFDTTFFSYLSVSGIATDAMNAALVALQTDMIDRAMKFKGKIKEDVERDTNKNKEVYLCDCTDDTKPTHGLPIAEKCTKYDMCLGCERAEVYTSHIKYICFRILQYNEFAKNNPLNFSALLEDRRQIAMDTLDKFRQMHSEGEQNYQKSYAEANDALRKGEQLLPNIIQFS